jgi:hypothetical protein
VFDVLVLVYPLYNTVKMATKGGRKTCTCRRFTMFIMQYIHISSYVFVCDAYLQYLVCFWFGKYTVTQVNVDHYELYCVVADRDL